VAAIENALALATGCQARVLANRMELRERNPAARSALMARLQLECRACRLRAATARLREQRAALFLPVNSNCSDSSGFRSAVTYTGNCRLQPIILPSDLFRPSLLNQLRPHRHAGIGRRRPFFSCPPAKFSSGHAFRGQE
jgi:hypothetical protein